MLDLFCGRFGWGRAFADRGWEVVGLDLVEPPEIPEGCTFVKDDALMLHVGAQGGIFLGPLINPIALLRRFDFICASSPCENFSIHRLKNFHPDAPYPELGIR